ncbi:hypothetical protein ANANG_G00253260 [Anguilla anguilla]|uniref:Uncharacterized protein n=1 Tax=Anguilla anguilla TaxID=7936 RepID=A0A9D3LSS1_ANGAN|nr:hypothetical protein ANANG_G00253260 [Anguilla anguilla]
MAKINIIALLPMYLEKVSKQKYISPCSANISNSKQPYYKLALKTSHPVNVWGAGFFLSIHVIQQFQNESARTAVFFVTCTVLAMDPLYADYLGLLTRGCILEGSS